jgi:Holliday junction DNA helicase RuvA
VIAQLAGQLVNVEDTTLVLDVHGVGYELEVSGNVLLGLPQMGEALRLHTHLVVREDAQLLYGFASKQERELFRAFIRINGVGPKLALALISSLELSMLARIVASNDVSALTRVPGVGKKTAERLMIELKSRLKDLIDTSGAALKVVSVETGQISMVAEAEDALIALGYRPPEATRAITAVLAGVADAQGSTSAEELVRAALRTFAKSTNSV